MAITFYERNTVEKHIYGPINKSCLIYLSHSNLFKDTWLKEVLLRNGTLHDRVRVAFPQYRQRP
jgi:hypothetical protein